MFAQLGANRVTANASAVGTDAIVMIAFEASPLCSCLTASSPARTLPPSPTCQACVAMLHLARALFLAPGPHGMVHSGLPWSHVGALTLAHEAAAGLHQGPNPAAARLTTGQAAALGAAVRAALSPAPMLTQVEVPVGPGMTALVMTPSEEPRELSLWGDGSLRLLLAVFLLGVDRADRDRWDVSAAAYAACLRQLGSARRAASYRAQLAQLAAGSPPPLSLEELHATICRLASDAVHGVLVDKQPMPMAQPPLNPVDLRALHQRAAASLLRLRPADPEAHLVAACHALWYADNPADAEGWLHAQRAMALALEQGRAMAATYAAGLMAEVAGDAAALPGGGAAAAGLPPPAEMRRAAAAAQRDAAAAFRAECHLLPKAWKHHRLAKLEMIAAKAAGWEGPGAAAAGGAAAAHPPTPDELDEQEEARSRCAGCGRKGLAFELSRCSRCRSVRYCR